MPKRSFFPRICCIETCKSTISLTNTIHPFPKSVKERMKWLKMIAYSNPESAKVKESDYGKLGVCDKHFLPGQIDCNGRRKAYAIPMLITPKEVSVGVPITSFGWMLNSYTLSDEETESEQTASVRKRMKKTYTLSDEETEALQTASVRKCAKISYTLSDEETESLQTASVRKCAKMSYTLSDDRTEPVQTATVRKCAKKTAPAAPAVPAPPLALAAPATVSIKPKEKAVCRLCLVTDVKMFSLESQPLKEYFKYFASNFDEIESGLSNNFPQSVCYMCANSLRKCFDFGNKCVKSQSILMDVFLISSEINYDLIKEYKKSILIPQHNLSTHTLSGININSSSSSDNKVLKNYFNLSNGAVKSSEGLDNVLKSEEIYTIAKIENVDVEENEEQMSVEYLEPVALYNDVEVKFETTKQKDAPQPVKTQEKNISPCLSAQKSYVPKKSGINNPKLMETENEDSNNVVFVDITKAAQEPAKDTSKSQSEIPRVPVEITKEIDAPQPVYKQTIGFSSFLSSEKTFVARTSDINQPKLVDTENEDSDDVFFVDVPKPTQDPAKDIPNLCQSQIKILKKSVYNSHGDVEIKTMFYEGSNITVIMENAQGKQVRLKLSRRNSLQEGGAGKKAETPSVVHSSGIEITFAKECWNVEHLTREQLYLIRQKRKQSAHIYQAEYQCHDCYKGFQTYKRLELHKRKHDRGVDRLCCSICFYYFDDANQLREHRDSHRTQFYCKMCPILCQSLKDATNHQLAHAIYQCPVCNQEFRFPIEYTKHKHNENDNEDSQEGGLTEPYTKPIIKYPISKVVEKQPSPPPPPLPKYRQQWSATCCDKTYRRKAAFRRHYSKNHPDLNCPLNEEAIVCELCGKLFDGQRSMALHLDKHSDNTDNLFKCDYCPKMFRFKHKLVRHILIHIKGKLFPCTKCPKKYRKHKSLRNHLREVHNIYSKKEGIICELCGKKVSNMHNLKTHILYRHMGIKPTKPIMDLLRERK